VDVSEETKTILCFDRSKISLTTVIFK